MRLEKIITLANQKSRLRFLAMVRSLRKTGCELPVLVIPYDDNRFDLPENCTWWEQPPIAEWINGNGLWPAFKKIQCFSEKNYQFVNSDIVFLKNPEQVLQNLQGFITSCLHWNNTDHTTTDETIVAYKSRSTTWQKLVFNSGQWACDTILYPDPQALISYCENNFRETLFSKNYLYKDQAGINILVLMSNVRITNITLPPHDMESTWAGDYTRNDFETYWSDPAKMPYLIHWAGCDMQADRPIDSLFLRYLTADETKQWREYLKHEKRPKPGLIQKIRKLRNVLRSI